MCDRKIVMLTHFKKLTNPLPSKKFYQGFPIVSEPQYFVYFFGKIPRPAVNSLFRKLLSK